MARKDLDLPPLKTSVLRTVGALQVALDWERIPPNISDAVVEFIEALEKFEKHLLSNKRSTDFSYCGMQKEVWFDQSDIYARL